MSKGKSISVDLDDMIDAGIKAVDLFKIANEDLIRREHLKQFLAAALAKGCKR